MIHPQGRRLPDVICFSHLRWNFVFQRPQHLMTRCARECRRLFFFEEPIFEDGAVPRIDIQLSKGVHVVVPFLPAGLDERAAIAAQRDLLDELVIRQRIQTFVAWYYTPMALPFSRHLAPAAVVYDCMDELASFKNAPAVLKEREAALLSLADLVLTGGQSLYEAKRHQHDNIHPFPSSVDVDHFAQGRRVTEDAADQAAIPHPRLGFFGVIDERMDIELLDGIAAARPDWHLVLLGPIVKIDPAQLPRRPNIHYLGPKQYHELPQYVGGWDVALLPFARNEATRFISPTKTPEYMAAGKPVVSTSIRDVVRPYGQQGLVRIADDAPAFAAACEAAMAEDASERVRQHDAFLRQTSWDGTWLRIRLLVEAVLRPERGRVDITAGGLAG
ncbi:MAG TPA: glycosyltransferase family 1 protein [Vicinamibacterales bacterium]|nr:glycosyltransferase family 1 protein [Vicinamibacterales bacterium]